MRGIRAGGPQDQRSSGLNSSLERVDKNEKGAGSYQTTQHLKSSLMNT